MDSNSQAISLNSEHLLSGILDISLNGIIAFKAVRENNKIVDFEWLLLNKKALQIYGPKSQFFVGKRLGETLPDALNKGLFKKYVEVVETGNPFHSEHFYTYAPLEGIWAEIVAVKFEDGVMITFSDITERKKKEGEIENIKEFVFLADAIPQIVWVSSADGRNVEYYNRRWYEYTGLTPEESKDQGWREVIYPEDLHSVAIKLERAISNGTVFESEFRMKNVGDGNYRWFLARMIPMKNDKGIIVKWFGTSTDINDHKTTEEALNNINKKLSLKNDELQRINADLDNFIYTASHDLKAPIANLEGLLNAYVDEAHIKDEHLSFINLMYDSIARFKNTIKDLTDIGKIQRGGDEELEIIDISEMLDEVKLNMKKVIEESNAQIEVDLKVENIKYSPKNFRSIIYNLVSNAIKYSSPERVPVVKVSTEIEGSDIVLKVADNGLGISKENLPKVFGMFKRFHQHVDGTGVGLYIVKRMVENAKGRIELESEAGKGSVFKVYFKDIGSK